MTAFEVFSWGFFGSAAVDVVTACQFYNDRGGLPERYNEWGFWFFRVLLACVGGGLAIAYELYDRPLLAVNIGVCTPLLIAQLSQGIRGRQEILPVSTKSKKTTERPGSGSS